LLRKKNIAEFKARIAKEKKENRADYEKKLLVLEDNNSDLKKKLADLFNQFKIGIPDL